MDYDLVLCEGTCESAFVDLLLERGLLILNRLSLLGGRVFPQRQLNPMLEEEIRYLSPLDKVTIRRIGDKQDDVLRLPRNSLLRSKIAAIELYETRPEFETLFLLREGKYEAFLKARNKGKKTLKPSVFYKSLHSGYNKQSAYVKEYFAEMSNREIVALLGLYLSKRGRVQGRKVLFDLLNEQAQALRDH